MCAVCCVDSSIFILVFHCIHIRGQRRRPALARHIANCRCTLHSLLFLLSSHAFFGFSIHTFFEPRQPPCENTWLKILRRRRDASLLASNVGFVVFLWALMPSRLLCMRSGAPGFFPHLSANASLSLSKSTSQSLLASRRHCCCLLCYRVCRCIHM